MHHSLAIFPPSFRELEPTPWDNELRSFKPRHFKVNMRYWRRDFVHGGWHALDKPHQAHQEDPSFPAAWLQGARSTMAADSTETPWNSYLEEHHINGFSDASYRWNLMDLFCPLLGYLFIIQFPSLTVMNFRFICPWRFNPGRGGRGFRLGLWVLWRPPSDSMDGLDLTRHR